jgi:hypothetical protein
MAARGIKDTTVRDNHVRRRTIVATGLDLLNFSDNIHPFDNLTKDDMAAIEPRRLDSCEEKLGSVRIGARIRHGQYSGARVSELEVFVSKLFSVNRFSSSPIEIRKITALDHEVFDHAMEFRALVAKSFRMKREFFEIGGGLGNNTVLDGITSKQERSVLIHLKHLRPIVVKEDNILSKKADDNASDFL